jgi:hypothetical protein
MKLKISKQLPLTDRMMKIIIWNNLLNFNNKEVQLKKSERTLKNKQTKKMKILIFNHL